MSSRCCRISSLTKKYFMGFTGLLWCGFVAGHMAGNLLLLVGAEAFNRYGHAIVSNPLLPVIESVLVLTLVVHAYWGLKLAWENKQARPQGYAVSPSGPKKASLAARWMAGTGSLILAFVILHIATFKYGPHYSVTYGGVEMRDLHQLVIEVFHQPGYVAWYVFCLLLLGIHLSHGFSSTFQSLGFRHPRYTPLLKTLGCFYAVIVAGGFILQPLYVFLIMKS